MDLPIWFDIQITSTKDSQIYRISQLVTKHWVGMHYLKIFLLSDFR